MLLVNMFGLINYIQNWHIQLFIISEYQVNVLKKVIPSIIIIILVQFIFAQVSYFLMGTGTLIFYSLIITYSRVIGVSMYSDFADFFILDDYDQQILNNF